MANGLGRGRDFGFRGSSPPWPYLGRGRGGLPRCGYFSGARAYQPSAFPPGTRGYAPDTAGEQELGYLKSQAAAMKSRLEEIEARQRALEAED
jgi:hypothetical protein